MAATRRLGLVPRPPTPALVAAMTTRDDLIDLLNGPEPGTVCTFYVMGDPAPQGSKRHVGGGRLIESSKKVAPWRTDVAAAAQEWRAAHGRPQPLDGPVAARLVFFLRKPISTPKKVVQPLRKPDLDKLVRSTFDALKGVIWADDARVVSLHAEKRYAAPGEPTGCRITVGSA